MRWLWRPSECSASTHLQCYAGTAPVAAKSAPSVIGAVGAYLISFDLRTDYSSRMIKYFRTHAFMQTHPNPLSTSVTNLSLRFSLPPAPGGGPSKCSILSMEILPPLSHPAECCRGGKKNCLLCTHSNDVGCGGGAAAHPVRR